MKKLTQKDIIMEFYRNHPNTNIDHPQVVDWCTDEFKKRTGKTFRDPDRQIRSLAQIGFLIKIKDGVYRYEPENEHTRELEDFSQKQKQTILKRDNYKCAVCGLGRKEGLTLHVDHIKPKDHGGKAILENGQVLCGPHNFLKKNFKQTETGKKMFIRLYELSKKEDNKPLLDFCTQILEVFERNNINGHIIWNK